MPAGAPEVVGEIIAVPVNAIDIGQRLRPVDSDWAAALGQIMAVEGQNTPVEVCRLPGSARFQLVSGGHRLRGASFAGLATINAIVVDNDALKRRAREVSENLWRKGLDPIDRAAFIAELCALQRVGAGLSAGEDGRKVSAQVRWQRALKAEAGDATLTVSFAYGWAADVAEKIGLSAQTVYRDLALHRCLAPDVVGRLRGHPLSSHAGQLRALARLSPGDQRTVVDLILAGEAKTVAAAAGVLSQKPRPSPDAKAWSAFFGGWSRMSAARRREALADLSKRGLPTGVRLVFDKGE